MHVSTISDVIYQQFLTELLAGNRQSCHAIVSTLLERGIDIRVLYTDLLQRSLYQVGKLWETNVISVAVEHMATSVTESLFTLVYPHIFAAEHSGKRAVVSCVANEYHQVGAKMVADIMELNGWDTYFLGANVPENDLCRLLDQKRPDVLCLSLAVFHNYPNLLRAVENLRARYAELPIIVGGQGFLWGGHDIGERFPLVSYLPSLSALEEHLALM